MMMFGCGGAEVFVSDASSEGGDGSATGDGSSNNDGSVNDGASDGAACQGKHPIVDAGMRYCGLGDCYCMGKDSCFPMAIAKACCGDTMVRCN